MTPKEAFECLCDLSKLNEEDFKMWVGLRHDVDKSLTELEELKRDVKRFMELMDKYMTFVFLCDEETNDEYDELSKKLMKVGK